jgi:hypothetical protein
MTGGNLKDLFTRPNSQSDDNPQSCSGRRSVGTAASALSNRSAHAACRKKIVCYRKQIP